MTTKTLTNSRAQWERIISKAAVDARVNGIPRQWRRGIPRGYSELVAKWYDPDDEAPEGELTPTMEQQCLGGFAELLAKLQGEEPPIEPERWGKDHWSTFAYLGSRNVDYLVKELDWAYFERDKIRCDHRRHPMLLGPRQEMIQQPGNHPTRLQGGDEVFDHDDWDCLMDMHVFGFVNVGSYMLCYFRLTELGLRVYGDLMAAKCRGIEFGAYSLPDELLKQVRTD